VNNLTTVTEFVFKKACPDKLLVSLEPANVSLSAGDQTQFVVKLHRDNGKAASDNIRIDLTVSSDDVVAVNKTSLSQTGEATFVLTPKKEGTVDITAQVSNLDCPDAKTSDKLTLKVIP
jgi:hypothetical protein